MPNSYTSSITYSSPLSPLPAIVESSPPKENDDSTGQEPHLLQPLTTTQNSPQYTVGSRAPSYAYRNRRLTGLKDQQPRQPQSSDLSSPYLPTCSASSSHTPPTYSNYSQSTLPNNYSFDLNYSSPVDIPRKTAAYSQYHPVGASSVHARRRTASYHTPHRPNQALYTVTRSGPQHAHTIHRNQDYLTPQYASSRAHPTAGMPVHWEPKPYYGLNSQALPSQSQSVIFSNMVNTETDSPDPTSAKATPPNRHMKAPPARYGPAFSKASPSAKLKYGPPSPPPFIRPDTPGNELCAIDTGMPWGYWAGRFSGLLDVGANTLGMEMGGWTAEVVEMVKRKADETIRKECMTREALESYEGFWSVMELCKEK